MYFYNIFYSEIIFFCELLIYSFMSHSILTSYSNLRSNLPSSMHYICMYFSLNIRQIHSEAMYPECPYRNIFIINLISGYRKVFEFFALLSKFWLFVWLGIIPLIVIFIFFWFGIFSLPIYHDPLMNEVFNVL